MLDRGAAFMHPILFLVFFFFFSHVKAEPLCRVELILYKKVVGGSSVKIAQCAVQSSNS